MQIADKTVVSIHYTLTDSAGKVIDSSQEDEQGEPLSYVHGSGMIVPGLEEALLGKSEGERVKVTLPPETGYGPRVEALIQSLAREQFPEGDIEVGMQFRAHGGRVLTVTAVDKDTVTVDGNHPLAGATLNFDVSILSVRAATPQDLHGPDFDSHACGGCSGCGGH